jgi:hypothetical protein
MFVSGGAQLSFWTSKQVTASAPPSLQIPFGLAMTGVGSGAGVAGPAAAAAAASTSASFGSAPLTNPQDAQKLAASLTAISAALGLLPKV